MPLAKDRELIPISTQAHQHLKAVVAAMKKNGIPTSGTMIASQVILSIPVPQSSTSVEKKRRAPRKAQAPQAQPVAAL